MIVLIRHENELAIPMDKVRGGYGFDFKMKTTKASSNAHELSGSFRNIISYKLGKFNMLVRCYVDGVKPESDAEPVPKFDVPLSDEPQDFHMSECLRFMTGGELSNEWKTVEITTRYAGKSFPGFL